MTSVTQTSLPGVLIIDPDLHPDDRGFFLETYQADRYRELIGIDVDYVQDNHSRSHRGVLRGIHAQTAHPQGKLVRVARGEVYDLVVDINPASETFGNWMGITLSDQSGRQLWIPPGYGHGFLVTSDVADFEYKCTDYYTPGDEIGVIWNDAEVAIDWPIREPIVSPKDRALPPLSELKEPR
mgnify:CR=1 FL=1